MHPTGFFFWTGENRLENWTLPLYLPFRASQFARIISFCCPVLHYLTTWSGLDRRNTQGPAVVCSSCDKNPLSELAAVANAVSTPAESCTEFLTSVCLWVRDPLNIHNALTSLQEVSPCAFHIKQMQDTCVGLLRIFIVDAIALLTANVIWCEVK
jgi:hypothetical protein